MDTNQVINGIALLLSFFVGYKYALKSARDVSEGTASASSTNQGSGDGATFPEDGATFTEDIFASFSKNYKMVLVVRNDLKMGKGKVGAQCGHGAVGAYRKAMQRNPHLVQGWENTGCAKIALRVESEAEMVSIKRAAEAQGLTTFLVRDAGRTQIEPNTKTVLAIGPATGQDIDKVTGHLKLL